MKTSSEVAVTLAAKLKASLAFHSRSNSGDDTTDEPTEPDQSLGCLMEDIMSIHTRPFLVSQRRGQRRSLCLDRGDIQVGELLRRGAFTQTYEIARCTKLALTNNPCHPHTRTEAAQPMGSQSERNRNTSFGGRFRGRNTPEIEDNVLDASEPSSSRRSRAASPMTMQYTLRCLRPREELSEDGNGPGPLLRMTRDLLLEAMYLAVLDHPSIITLAAFPNPSGNEVFVVTERCDETLEDRMLMWRQIRRERQEKEAKHYKKERERIERHNREQTRKRSTETLQQYNERQKKVYLLHTPTPFHEEVKSLYPEDLVALKTNYALQIASGLEYLHARGIVLCNLRPDTIGFKEYPHHHSVKIMDLTSAKELCMDEENPSLPATELPQAGHLNEMDSDVSGCSYMDDVSYSSWHNVPSPFGKSHSKHQTQASRRSHAHATPSDSSSSSSWWSGLDMNASLHGRPSKCRHKRSAASASLSPSYKARRSYHAPELYVDPTNPAARFNAKVDSFSFAVIYFELLNDRRAFPSNATVSDQEHLHRLRVQKLRPSLEQSYFPLAIKEIMRQAWSPEMDKRWDAAQIVRSLTRILPVLEGRRLHHGIAAEATSRQQSTKAAMALASLTLSERAVKVVHSKAAQGWEQVWNTTPRERAW